MQQIILPNPLPMLVPFGLWVALGPAYIGWLRTRMFGQFIREDGPQSHHKKAGTPTMGGLLILLAVLVAVFGFALFSPALLTPELLWALLVLVVFGALGFSDDWLKVAKKHNKGLSGWSKLAIQIAVGLALGTWVLMNRGGDVSVFGWATLHMGWFYPVFALLVITGASNAYNLTDGLDGLASSTGFITFCGLALLMAVTHSDLTLFSLLLAGGCMGFLLFNRYPAKVFMGDTGSLALGGVMGALVVLSGLEFFLLLLGGIFVIEALSVMLQVGYFKLTKGKRLFKMSPLHHHFELSGWQEPAIVVTFILFQAAFGILALLLYNRS